MQLLVQHDQKHVVRNVELIILDLIVGTPVVIFALTVLVVTAAVFETTFMYG